MKIIFFIMTFWAVGFAGFGVDTGLQHRWAGGNLFNAAVVTPGIGDRGYLTFGVNFQPAKLTQYSVDESLITTGYKNKTYYGAYTGYHLMLSPVVRPGAVLGFGWGASECFAGNTPNGYTNYSGAPYFGLDVHIWLFSFRVSNEGIGGGFNYVF